MKEKSLALISGSSPKHVSREMERSQTINMA
jgi:hypothetical protein